MKRLLRYCAACGRTVTRATCAFARSLWSLLGPAPGRPGLKRWLLQAATWAVLAGVGGFLVAASGIVPIKASSGHWPITAWLLEFSMSRSVATHTLGMEAPALADRGLVLKGAGHYETGCFPCHGSPEMPYPRIPQAMTPHPPYLPPIIHKREPEELFYLVKHGVKFTGMPAWPTQQRDDEVWAMVAFLLRLPELDAREYRRLVSGETAPGKEDAPLHGLTGPEAVPRANTDNCRRCHGAAGQGRGAGVFPKLAGQRAEYLEASLLAYARGERHSGIMEPIAAGLSQDEMRELAHYYAGLKGATPDDAPVAAREAAAASEDSAAAIQRGARIAQEGVPSRRIPVCTECHGPGDAPRDPNYPSLAGQPANYLVLQLELFQERNRGGSDYAHLMHPVADRLTPEHMRDVALYYESLAIP